MASNLHRSATAANAANDAQCAQLNGGFLRIYDGVQPADANTAITTQNLLAELRFGNPAYPPSVGGSSVNNAISDDLAANATGTATWYRALQADGVTVVQDGSVGTSGADLNFSSTAFTVGQDISVPSLTINAAQ